MDTNQLISYVQGMASLYAEILVCILAAGVLGWIAGWMTRRARGQHKLNAMTRSWEQRYHALESASRIDAENLEEQLQSIANETKTLQSTNRTLTDTLKKHDTSNQKVRAESIELNRQHTETHDRLQRIIQHKDREILELGNRLNIDHQSSSQSASTHNAFKSSHPTQLRASAPVLTLTESDLNSADTIAISPEQLNNDVLDATIQMTLPSALSARMSNVSTQGTVDDDEFLDDTADLSGVGVEESTIAMDDEALAFAQRSHKGRSD